MIVYRIAKTIYIKDLSGIGARLYGGRWNNKGTGVLYTSETRALAIVEFLVRVPSTAVPKGLSFASIEIPDHIIPRQILMANLPKNWKDYPSQTGLSNLGTNWASTNNSLLLRVPSAVVPHEFNILINPQHMDMKHVKITDIESYIYDSRLLS